MLSHRILTTRWIGWTWLRHVLIAMVLSYVLALSAQVRASIPFSPVPVTAQTLVVLLFGGLLPRRMIGSTFGLYLLAGGLGLPYFAGASLAGPTGGYLLGFVVAAFTVSVLMESGWVRGRFRVVLVLLIGNALIYALGLPWLALFVGLNKVVVLGLLPFVVGDLFKLFCAAGIVIARNRL